MPYPALMGNVEKKKKKKDKQINKYIYEILPKSKYIK